MTMAIASAMMLQPTCAYVRSSLGSDGNEPDNHFDFSISRELLLNPQDVEVGEMIGEGGYFIVHKGLYKNQIPVAVKIVQPSRTSAVSIEFKEKFQKEVLVLSKMKHDNIVKLVGACIEPQLMIVTELLEGGTLQRFLWNTRPNPLDLKMSLSFALDIARAMDYLHSNDVIYRDLNPSNVLVTGDTKHVKLADFGLAREESTGGMTSEAGTYTWMAPELCRHELLKIEERKYYDHKVDVYSFALVFWELLTNEIPFKDVPRMSIPVFASMGQRPSLRNIPDEAVSVLQSCWAEDSNERPEFKEIIVILTNLLNNLSSDNSNGTTLLEEEANDHGKQDSETTCMLQECQCEVKEPKKKNKKNKKKKKVVNYMKIPFFKLFNACFWKP